MPGHEKNSSPGRLRDPEMLSTHWALAVWILARWCVLKDKKWRVRDGCIFWPCVCGRALDVRFSSGLLMELSNQNCPDFRRRGPHRFPPLFYTCLSDFFKLLRQRLEGTRGPPILGDIPFLVQAPVLHCTGKISK